MAFILVNWFQLMIYPESEVRTADYLCHQFLSSCTQIPSLFSTPISNGNNTCSASFIKLKRLFSDSIDAVFI